MTSSRTPYGEEELEKITARVQSLSTSDPPSSSQTINGRSSCNYCDSERSIDQLLLHARSIAKSSSEMSPVFLDCEGLELGRRDGKLGLVQVGIENSVYLVDIIKCPKSLDILKEILESPAFTKVVWDGRHDYAQLWHEHRIGIDPILDLQLVRVHTKLFRPVVARGAIRLDGMMRAFTDLPAKEPGFNFKLFNQGSVPARSAANKSSTKQNQRKTCS